MRDKVQGSGIVTVLNGAKVTKILGDKMVTGIKIVREGKEESVAVQGVFVEIGLVPNSKFTKGIDKNEHGEIKVRGIETRQRGVSKIIKYYQNQVFDIMAKFRTKEEITNSFPVFCSLLRELVNVLHYLKPEALSSFVVVSKTDYKNNIPQKIVLEQLKKKSIKIVAGQKVSYIFSTKGAVLPEDYKHNPDIMRYRRLLVRSLFVIMQPFGFTKDDIYRMIKDERQTTLIEHCKTPLHTDAKDIQIPQASV